MNKSASPYVCIWVCMAAKLLHYCLVRQAFLYSLSFLYLRYENSSAHARISRHAFELGQIQGARLDDLLVPNVA